jgi:glycosyltransferase involved in cell wall biosynthesis
MPRAVVYNAFWSTGGGAEAYGGAIAELLSRDYAVELLGHDSFDRDALAERLSLDLSSCTVATVPQASAAVTDATRGVPLFVNVSHRSRDVSSAQRSLYVVHFPTVFAAGDDDGVQWGTGWHVPDGDTTWSDGRGRLLVRGPVSLRIRIGFSRPRATELRVLLDGEEVARRRVGGGRSLRHRAGTPVQVEVPAGRSTVALVSDTFSPAGDRRTLGVPVRSVEVGGCPTSPSASMDWLDSYDRVVANSAFTAGWVRELWRRDATVLHPPVSLRPPGHKTRSILSVGRFIPTGRGHSKKQLELVQAFRRLVDDGLVDWTLHLVGGLAGPGQEYFAQLQAAAAGYPVEVHPDASGVELSALYGQAAIYWHAAGLGEEDPERLEHFGISTVEAMSAGAVPVVVGLGGLVETVRDGVDGYLFRDLDELITRTRQLVDDERLRTRMSQSAQSRAQDFSLPAFDERLQQLLR